MIKIVSTFFRVIPQNFNERHRVGMDTLLPVLASISATNSSQNQSTLSLTSSVRICIEYVCKISTQRIPTAKQTNPDFHISTYEQFLTTKNTSKWVVHTVPFPKVP